MKAECIWKGGKKGEERVGGKKWKAFEGGGLRISFKPVQQYDGVLFFKKVTPAVVNVE